MMYFENHNYLYGLGIVPVVVLLWFLSRYRQKRIMHLLGDRHLISNLIVTSPLYLQIVKLVLQVLVFTLLVFALAQPYSIKKIRVKNELAPTDIVFVVDVSKSMYVNDMAPNRLSRAKRLMKDILQQLKNEQVGVVLFAGKAGTFVPLTNDYNYVNSSIESISGSLIDQQGTSLREAFKISKLLFDPNTKSNKIICLLSDGEFHDKGEKETKELFKKSNIQVFAFGFGTKLGGEVPVDFSPTSSFEKNSSGEPIISYLHQKELTNITGSPLQYIEVSDNAMAAKLFVKKLAKMKESTFAQSHKPLSAIFLGITLFLLIIEISIPQIVKNDR